MNIAVDIGNTFIKLGTFQDGKQMGKEVIRHIEDAIAYVARVKPENIIVSSVKHDPHVFKDAIGKNGKIIVFSHDLFIPIKNKYKNPKTLGSDRLAAAVGSNTLFPNKNCLSIDIGTCITFDIIDEEGCYLGGSISPGLSMKFKALHTFTSRLPLIEPVGKTDLIGKTTQDSILSGVINGTLAEIEHMIGDYNNIFDNLQVIICGGDTKFFESRIKAPIFVVPDLVLIGLNRILEHNV